MLSLTVNVSACMFINFLSFEGASQNQKSGTDALLDLLSIGSPPTTNSASTPDILSLSLESKNSGSPQDQLSSVLPLPVQGSSPSGAAPIVDLLDVLSSNPPTSGMLFSVCSCQIFCLHYSHCYYFLFQRSMVCNSRPLWHLRTVLWNWLLSFRSLLRTRIWRQSRLRL